jgi:hypothetical protein
MGAPKFGAQPRGKRYRLEIGDAAVCTEARCCLRYLALAQREGPL